MKWRMGDSTERRPDEDLADYGRLVAKVDQHAARVTSAHAAAFACARGCTGCCHVELSVFPVEAASIRGWLGGLRVEPEVVPPPAPHAVALLGLAGRAPCAMLGADGLCRIYPVRPLICRTHGLPLALEDEDGLAGDVCPLNFDGGADLADVDLDDFLVVDTLNVVLVAVNAAYIAAMACDGERVALREIAAGR
ncbi:MAG: Fe-S-cluster containining protein [Myxococcota bacterium]|jgi:Fe-S-cluster containining protein